VNLVIVGNDVMNLDNATRIDLVARKTGEDGLLMQGVRVCWNSGVEGDNTLILDHEGGRELREHLRSIARNLTPASAEDREFAIYQQRGGSLPRTLWDEKHRQLRSYISNPQSWHDKPENARRVGDLECELLL
jgi:hypothetical protein